MRASYVHVSNRHQIEELKAADHLEDDDVDIISDIGSGLRSRQRERMGASAGVREGGAGKAATMEPSWRKDKWAILLLLVLYTLQGIPMGLSSAVPFMLVERGASYSDQATFSLVSWPYATKLLWAPIVDSLGRRRHWVIGSQLLVGACMVGISAAIDALMDDVWLLTSVFLGLYFFVATQDIAVDGWALTLLSRENVGYASTCNTVGQYLGFSIAYVVFLALNSEDFCNGYLRASPAPGGMITLAQFLFGWGVVFVVVTLALPFVHGGRAGRGGGGSKVADAAPGGDDGEVEGPARPWERVAAAYREMWAIVRLPAVMTLGVLLLTSRVGLSMDALLGLKLVERGVPKDKLALVGTSLLPLEIAMPVVVSRLVVGSLPLRLYRLGLPARLLLALPYLALVLWMPALGAGEQPPAWVYAGFLLISIPYRAAANTMFVSQMAFFARVSDPRVGGTYMTLLNTLANLGGQWPSALTLRAMGALTAKTCSAVDEGGDPLSDCGNEHATSVCTAAGGRCSTVRDGFVPIVMVSLALGAVWVAATWRTIDRLQRRPLSDWRCSDDVGAGADSGADTDEEKPLVRDD